MRGIKYILIGLALLFLGFNVVSASEPQPDLVQEVLLEEVPMCLEGKTVYVQNRWTPGYEKDGAVFGECKPEELKIETKTTEVVEWQATK